MRVLYISYDGMTDDIGQSQVLPYLIKLGEIGIEFTILSCEKEERYFKNWKDIQSICQEHSINWEYVKYRKSPPVISTIKDISDMSALAQRLVKQSAFDVVHCRSYLPALIAMTLKKKFSLPVLFDMRGFYPEEKTEINVWPQSKPIFKLVYQYFKKKEKQFFVNSDHIVSLTEAGKKEILSRQLKSVTSQKIDVIPCSVDFNHFIRRDDQQISQKRKELGISNDEMVISFLGSLGQWYMLQEMFDFFKVFKRYFQSAKFLFITSEDPKMIKEKAELNGINRNDLVVMYGQRNIVPLLLSISDYGLFFIKPYFSKKGSSPTKLGEYMALDIPVFTNVPIGDVREILSDTQGGETIESFNEEEYTSSIQRMIARGNKKFKIRELAFPYYNIERAVLKYQEIYQRIKLN